MFHVKLHKPKAIKIYHPVVLVMGDGRSLLSDLDEFLSWNVPHDAYSIGRSYQAYNDKNPGNKILHWGNIDSVGSKWWVDRLPNRERIQAHTVGGDSEIEGYDYDWDIAVPWDDNVRWRGSTSLFAAMSCVTMGYDKVILAGCPLDKNGHWYFGDMPENTGPNWAPEDLEAWRHLAKLPLAEKVRSLSGFTADVIGKATPRWV